jgi:hypothetical protein
LQINFVKHKLSLIAWKLKSEQNQWKHWHFGESKIQNAGIRRRAEKGTPLCVFWQEGGANLVSMDIIFWK